MKHGVLLFFATLLGLAVLRVFLGLLSVPVAFIEPASLLITALYVALPIFAFFKAAETPWSPGKAWIFIGAGLIVHFTLLSLIKSEVVTGLLAAVCASIVQIGILTWCVGLGALLSTMLKDRNLLIPVSIFLAAFDIFSVLTPVGPTKVIMEKVPDALPSLAVTIPKISSSPTGGPIGAYAMIGPADWIFIGMFLVALFRFNLRAKQTFFWLIPAILSYILLTKFFTALPLLVPIGLTVLIVNIREFKMNTEEKLSTGLIALIAIGLIAFGATRKAPKPEIEVKVEPQGSQAAPLP